jgi:hypothetical protein
MLAETDSATRRSLPPPTVTEQPTRARQAMRPANMQAGEVSRIVTSQRGVCESARCPCSHAEELWNFAYGPADSACAAC